MAADTRIYDLSISSDAIDSDAGLETAITLSLLTWARAQPDDVVPDPANLKGWWADTYAEVPGDSFGSRVWLLIGQPINAALIARCDAYIREALQWLIDDGHIGSVDIEIEVMSSSVLGARIGIRRPQQTTTQDIGLWEISLNAV